MSELSAHEVLVKARNLIDREGWWQDHKGADGGQCASNAISVVAPDDDDARRELKRAVGVVDLQELFAWNDAPGRTKEEVLAAFDKAISSTAPSPADPMEGVEMAEVVA